MNVLWNRSAYDATTVAAALLAQQKAHCRVDHTRDDALIPTYTAAAIALVDKWANINVAQATFESVGADVANVLPPPCRCYAGPLAYLLPFNNVREVRVFDAAAVDVSTGWTVIQEAFGANRDAWLMHADQTTLPMGGSVELDVGLDDVALIDPAVLLTILRVGASLYEYREANLPLTEDGFRSELSAIWRPTV
jgi:hypothetical protein